jgi:hypothetical protein
VPRKSSPEQAALASLTAVEDLGILEEFGPSSRLCLAFLALVPAA